MAKALDRLKREQLLPDYVSDRPGSRHVAFASFWLGCGILELSLRMISGSFFQLMSMRQNFSKISVSWLKFVAAELESIFPMT
jgi:hypothetical protein